MIWQTLETRRYSLPDFWSGEFKGRGKREEELHNAHDDWVPTRDFPSLIAFGNVHWSTNLLNPAHAWIKHTQWPAYYQIMWSVRPLTSLWMRLLLFQFSCNLKTKKRKRSDSSDFDPMRLWLYLRLQFFIFTMSY